MQLRLRCRLCYRSRPWCLRATEPHEHRQYHPPHDTPPRKITVTPSSTSSRLLGRIVNAQKSHIYRAGISIVVLRKQFLIDACASSTVTNPCREFTPRSFAATSRLMVGGPVMSGMDFVHVPFQARCSESLIRLNHIAHPRPENEKRRKRLRFRRVERTLACWLQRPFGNAPMPA